MNSNNTRQFQKGDRMYPKKRLGQHFLRDTQTLLTIVTVADISKNDHVIELGAGEGYLTSEISRIGCKLAAVEIDPRYVRLLENKFEKNQHVRIVQKNMLDIDPSVLFPQIKRKGGGSYQVIGNIPYYLTSKLIRHFLEEVNVKPRRITLLVQREVAERITATPPYMNVLAIHAQFHSHPALIASVSRNLFHPVPQVDSAIITFDIPIKPLYTLTTDEEKILFQLVHAGFSQKRKQLVNSISNAFGCNKDTVLTILEKHHIPFSTRPQELSICGWISLTKAFLHDKIFLKPKE